MRVSYGFFPFGKPNTERPMRSAVQRPAAVAVVGVYPSAWHVDWRAPAHLQGRGRRGRVAALAVDVEPSVFWNGSAADHSDRLAKWRLETGFIEGGEQGAHGFLSPTPPASNGSSGKKVEDRYLAPLGVAGNQAAFTDICPVFFVKYGSGVRREQGDAIEVEYNSIVNQLSGYEPSTLPQRPPPRQLVAMAVDQFNERIVSDLEAADAPLVITLGEEVLQALIQLPALAAQPPVEKVVDLYDVDRYGSEGTLRVNGREVRWLPMVHPGLLKGRADLDAEIDPAARTLKGWNALHGRWGQDATPQ